MNSARPYHGRLERARNRACGGAGLDHGALCRAAGTGHADLTIAAAITLYHSNVGAGFTGEDRGCGVLVIIANMHRVRRQTVMVCIHVL